MASALRERYSAEVSAEDLNLIFAHYLLGLVSALDPDAAPTMQLELLRHLGTLALTPEELTRALHALLPEGQSFVVRASEAGEKLGHRDGEAIRASSAAFVDDPIGVLGAGSKPRGQFDE